MLQALLIAQVRHTKSCNSKLSDVVLYHIRLRGINVDPSISPPPRCLPIILVVALTRILHMSSAYLA